MGTRVLGLRRRGEAKEVLMARTISDSDLLTMLAIAEDEEATWAAVTQRCASADSARRFGRATREADLVRDEVARRVIAAAEAMLD